MDVLKNNPHKRERERDGTRKGQTDRAMQQEMDGERKREI